MAVVNPERKITTLAMLATALITWRELKAGEIPPPPHSYVSVVIVYGVAHLVAEISGQLGFYLALAWTFMVAYSTFGDVLPARAHRGADAAGPAGADRTPSRDRRSSAGARGKRTPARRATTAPTRITHGARPRHRGRVPSRTNR